MNSRNPDFNRAAWLGRLAALILILALAGLSLSSCSSKGAKSEEEGGLSEADLNAQREGRFGAGGIPSAEGEGVFRDVMFDYDSSAISGIARSDIEANARILRENPELRVQLEGHCDERGTAEYNLTLGAERARAVKDVLVSLGISSSRLETVSYGEEVPLDPGQGESAWSRNRRAHFSAFRDMPKG
ncbi:MAG: peptidoglycan-associated lipoprotein [Proteobacteria bacterium]|nr:MAG: peptidoglycan-associated lipoprotein [Pseudomonadota bacterium]